MKKWMLLLLTITFLFLVVGCSGKKEAKSNQRKNAKHTELVVSAAASLTDAMDDLKAAFEKENTNVHITVNLGGSGNLAQQIQQGAPVDVFLSANQKWMNTLQQDNLLVNDTRTNFTGNKIVLIANKKTNWDIKSFKDINEKTIGQIAIGEPGSVPAGKYAKESLVSIGKWDQLKDHFVLAKDVRQVLAYVESGNTDIGFVYSSDALISDKVKVLAEAEPSWHTPIIYPAAVVATSNKMEIANKFIAFLETDKAQAILNKYGFKK